MSEEEKGKWQTACVRANLRITGYNLFTYWMTRQDRAAIATVERISKIDLVAS